MMFLKVVHFLTEMFNSVQKASLYSFDDNDDFALNGTFFKIVN